MQTNIKNNDYTKADIITIQTKVKDTVSDYIRLFNSEYLLFLKEIDPAKNSQINDFGEFKGNNYIVRKLGEVPETLWVAITTRLTDDEKGYLTSKKGAYWFYKTFPEFATAKKI